MNIDKIKRFLAQLTEELTCKADIEVDCEINHCGDIAAKEEESDRQDVDKRHDKEIVHYKVKKVENSWLRVLAKGILSIAPYVTIIWLAYFAKEALNILKDVVK